MLFCPQCGFDRRMIPPIAACPRCNAVGVPRTGSDASPDVYPAPPAPSVYPPPPPPLPSSSAPHAPVGAPAMIRVSPQAGTIALGLAVIGAAIWALVSWIPSHRPMGAGEVVRYVAEGATHGEDRT